MSALDEKEKQMKAKKIAGETQLFLLHLAGYIFLIILMTYNHFIMEDNPFANAVDFINSVVLIIWTVFIVMHGRRVSKARTLFKQQQDVDANTDLQNDASEEPTT